jgi:hypothetical protein
MTIVTTVTLTTKQKRRIWLLLHSVTENLTDQHRTGSRFKTSHFCACSERNAARKGEKRNAYRILVGMPERDDWEDQDVGGWTTLKCILQR